MVYNPTQYYLDKRKTDLEISDLTWKKKTKHG